MIRIIAVIVLILVTGGCMRQQADDAARQQADNLIRKQAGEALGIADGVKTAVAEFSLKHGRFPSSNAEAGLAAGTSIVGRYASSVTVRDGVISVTYSPGTAPALTGKTVVFRPTQVAGSLEWSCTSDIPQLQSCR